MPLETVEPDRRFRPVGDLSLFELAPLIGPDASSRQLKQAAASLADGYALERRDGDRWRVVGWTGTADRAQEWVQFRGEPDALPPA